MKLPLEAAEIKAIELILQETGLPPAPRSLILKVGSCLADDSYQYEIEATEEDLWFLRERVNLFTMMEGRNIGLPLKKKIYELLLQYDTQRQIGKLPISETEELSYRERSANDHPDPSQNTARD